MKNTKTSYQYLNDNGNWYPIEIKKCSMTRARGTINQGRPYQPVYIKDGKEHTIRYRKTSIESAIAELQTVVEYGDGTCNGKRYRLLSGDADAQEGSRLLRLFVYGTLKRGYWNHGLFCNDAVSIKEASVQGQLYELPSGIPVLAVTKPDILAFGSVDTAADMYIQEHTPIPRGLTQYKMPYSCKRIHGELITLGNPVESLPPIDILEGYRPSLPGIYWRVLLPIMVELTETIELAWCYVSAIPLPVGMRKISDTTWHPKSKATSVVRRVIPTGGLDRE